MIELHVEGETGTDPYQEPPAQQHSNTILAGQAQSLTRIANFSERQREKASPDAIDLSPTLSGAAIASTYATKTALRIVSVLFSGGTAGNRMELRVGQRPYPWRAGGDLGPIWFNLPIDVERGVDLSIADTTTPGSTNWTCIIFAYPME